MGPVHLGNVGLRSHVRGGWGLNCLQATATVLSRDYIQPAIQGPWVAGLQRVEYTMGVEGCGQRTSYVVLCQVGTVLRRTAA